MIILHNGVHVASEESWVIGRAGFVPVFVLSDCMQHFSLGLHEVIHTGKLQLEVAPPQTHQMVGQVQILLVNHFYLRHMTRELSTQIRRHLSLRGLKKKNELQ